MKKKVHMLIKVEPALRDQFMAISARRHRHAAQVVGDLMRAYVADNEKPNALTAAALLKSRRGDDVFHVSNVDELFKKLGISHVST